MNMFDYYIFIDYSEDIIGYLIIEKEKLKVLIPKINKFANFKELKYKTAYIHSIKRIIENKNIISNIFKLKIIKLRQNIEIYLDVLNFIKMHNNCIIFISIDNHEFPNFKKLVNIVNGEKTKIVQESQLKKGSNEYKISLVLDTLLNIERLSRKK